MRRDAGAALRDMGPEVLEAVKKAAASHDSPEVRLRAAFFVTATEAITDDDGNVVEGRATYDPATAGGQAPDGRKVKATIHWVSAEHAIDARVHLYDRLFSDSHPGADGSDPSRRCDGRCASGSPGPNRRWGTTFDASTHRRR